MKRCSWAANDLLIAYHDNEYGRIQTDNHNIFEKLCLESFSAGLSWYIVLKKREAFRTAFCGFSPENCAALTDDYLDSLREDAGIIRNAAKIYAVRSNAHAALAVIRDYGSLFKFIYSFKQPERLLSALKQYGFRQVGISAATELMKSLGIIEAHEPDCAIKLFKNEEQ